MKFTAAVIAMCISLVAALPAQVEERQAYVPCSGLYGTAQCCATDVLGVADLDCGVREWNSPSLLCPVADRSSPECPCQRERL
jgi:hypothetical protein